VSRETKQESEWERSAFAMTSDELDVSDAVNALRRLLHAPQLPPDALRAVHWAYEKLSGDRPPRA